MNGGDPSTAPVSVSRCESVSAREIPKSMTRTPSSASSTLPGFRSRCTSPRPWMSRSASASCAPTRAASRALSGPSRSTRSVSEPPGTNSVASHGGSPSGSASTTGAVYAPPTFRAAATSRRNLARNPGSWAYSRRITFTATCRPAGVRARYTTPMPPLPRRRSRT
ncbi:hypothetical protein MTQ13_11095 [Streptomyces sp. XM4011]|nr:hypothetical protein [Streptomyces sp. XM4011]MCK1814821.1 hypothetical protein [Streptomyces sp. XM4011]